MGTRDYRRWVNESVESTIWDAFDRQAGRLAAEDELTPATTERFLHDETPEP